MPVYQAEMRSKLLSINESITTTINFITKIRPPALPEVQTFIDEGYSVVSSRVVTVDKTYAAILVNVSQIERDISSTENQYERSELDLAWWGDQITEFDYIVRLTGYLNDSVDEFRALERNYLTENEWLIYTLVNITDNFIIPSMYQLVGIFLHDLRDYTKNELTNIYSVSYRDYYKHESAITDTYYYVRGYVLYNFNVYNNVEASFEKAYTILIEGINVIIEMRSGIDNSVLNSVLIDFRNKINATRQYFNAYLKGLLNRAYDVTTVLKDEILYELQRLNVTFRLNLYPFCETSYIATYTEMNDCLVKARNDYLTLSSKVVRMVDELNDLRNNTEDKGRTTYQTEYGKLITSRNGLLEVQFTSHNITQTDVNDYATKRITQLYNDGYGRYTNVSTKSVSSEANRLFARNDLLNLMSSGVLTALQNLKKSNKALIDSLWVVIEKINYAYSKNYDSIARRQMQLSKYFYVETLQMYKSTALGYICPTPAGVSGIQQLIQSLEECTLTKIDMFVGNKTNLDRGLESLVNSTLAYYRDYDVSYNVRFHVHPAISYSLTLASVNSSVYIGLKCFYDTDYRAYFMSGIDVVPETYNRCYSIIIVEQKPSYSRKRSNKSTP